MMDGVVFNECLIYKFIDVGFLVDLLISSFLFNKQAFAPRCEDSSGSIHFPFSDPLGCLQFFPRD